MGGKQSSVSSCVLLLDRASDTVFSFPGMWVRVSWYEVRMEAYLMRTSELDFELFSHKMDLQSFSICIGWNLIKISHAFRK